jgi:outer membrane protein
MDEKNDRQEEDWRMSLTSPLFVHPRAGSAKLAGGRLARAACVLAGLLGALGVARGAAAAQQNLKIGYVDSNKIIEVTPGVAEAKAAYEKQTQDWKGVLETKKNELTALYEDYRKQAAILSPEKKSEKQQTIAQKEREMQEYFQSKFGPQGEAGAKEKELLRPIYDKINKAIEEVRAAENYSLIFDVQAGAIAAGDSSLDLTEKVIARVKAGTTATSANATPGVQKEKSSRQ